MRAWSCHTVVRSPAARARESYHSVLFYSRPSTFDILAISTLLKNFDVIRFRCNHNNQLPRTSLFNAVSAMTSLSLQASHPVYTYCLDRPHPATGRPSARPPAHCSHPSNCHCTSQETNLPPTIAPLPPPHTLHRDEARP